MTRTNNSGSHRISFAHSIIRISSLAMMALSILILSATSAQAQRRSSATQTTTSSTGSSQSKVTFGGEFDLNYMMASINDNSLSGIGFHIGGVADIPVAPKTGVLAKLGYERRQGDYSTSSKDASVNVALTVNYFEIAGLVRHDVSDNVSLQGGLSIGLDAGGGNAQITATSGSQRASGNINGDLSMPTQFALVGGVGYRMSISPTMDLIPNASFNLSLTSLTPNGQSNAHALRFGARLMFK